MGGIKNLAQNLKELRLEKNMTQKELGEAIDVSLQQISLFENGREPNYNTLVRLADFFDVSIDYLVRGVDKRSIIVDKGDLNLAKAYIEAFIKDAEDNNRMHSYETATHYYQLLEVLKLLDIDEKTVITERLNKFWDDYMKNTLRSSNSKEGN